MIRVAGTLGKSSEVMKLVNDMVKLPELRSTMMEMSKGGWGGGGACWGGAGVGLGLGLAFSLACCCPVLPAG